MARDGGMVIFIGAGPGDPELLTLKARRLIGEADVIIYAGSLVDEAVGSPTEGQSTVFQVVYSSNSLFGENISRLLIDEIVTALNRVEGVPFRLVLLHIA